MYVNVIRIRNVRRSPDMPRVAHGFTETDTKDLPEAVKEQVKAMTPAGRFGQPQASCFSAALREPTENDHGGKERSASMPIHLMTRFLDGHQIDYADSRNPILQAPEDSPDRALAKTVMLSIDGSPAMAVIPAGHALRAGLLRELIQAENMCLAEPREVAELFPNCAHDAIPPLGMLHGMRVFVSDALADEDKLAFYAGSRSRIVEIPWGDYFRLVVPILAPISTPAEGSAATCCARAEDQELCLAEAP